MIDKRKVNQALRLFFVVILGSVCALSVSRHLVNIRRLDTIQQITIIFGLALIFAILLIILQKALIQPDISMRSRRQNCLLLVIIVFVAGYESILINPPIFPAHRIIIQPLNEANPGSTGTQVHLLEIRDAAQAVIPLSELSLGSGWQLQDNGIGGVKTEDSFGENQQIRVDFEGFQQGVVNFLFKGHPAAGKVKITLDGKEGVYDLYEQQENERIISITTPPASPDLSRFLITLTDVVALGWLLGVCIAGVFAMARFLEKTGISGNNRKQYPALILLDLSFILSATYFSGILSDKGVLWQVATGVVLPLIFWTYLSFKQDIVQQAFIKINVTRLFFALVFSFMTYRILIEQASFKGGIDQLFIATGSINFFSIAENALGWHRGAISLFALFVLWSFAFSKAIPLVKSFIYSLETSEKWYLIITSILFTIAILYVDSHTRIFLSEYDVIFTTDPGLIMINNDFLVINSYETIHHVLFGLYALPLGIVAAIIAGVVRFSPDVLPISLSILQIPFVGIGIICLSRMLKINGAQKTIFLALMTCTYPVFLFMITIEHYQVTFFWLIVMFYSCLHGGKIKEVAFIGATGTLLPSVICFPLLYSGSRNIMEFLKKSLLLGLKYLGCIALIGQMDVLFSAFVDIIRLLGRYGGTNVSMIERLSQYFNFVAYCFIKPESLVLVKNHNSLMSYQLASNPPMSILGIFIFCVAVLGFALNHQDRFVRIAFGWLIYSILILLILGWGTQENGLILYALYFSWAFVGLVFKAIERVLDHSHNIKTAVYLFLTMAIFCANIIGFWDLVQFTLLYHPLER